MSFKRGTDFAGCHVPNFDRPIKTSRSQRLVIRPEDEGSNNVGMAFKHFNDLAVCDIPEPNCAVLMTRSKCLAVSTESQGSNGRVAFAERFPKSNTRRVGCCLGGGATGRGETPG